MNDAEVAVVADALCKAYETAESTVSVLVKVSFKVVVGEFAVVSGPSGSGKTTLLNLIGGIDKPTSGRIVVLGEELSAKDEDFLASFRCRRVGYVFQAYNLVSTLTVAENVAFPMEWLKKPKDYMEKRTQGLLELLGLVHRAEHFPFQLSGGELQRVAFARALANDPPLLLVDEPTGNLDKNASGKIAQILNTLKDNGKTLVVATHDENIRELADQKWRLDDGRLVKGNE